MTRDEKITRALALRARGMPYRAIADEVGVSYPTAYRWLNPDYAAMDRAKAKRWKDNHREVNRARDRARDHALRHPCPTCGSPTSLDQCRSCRQMARCERIAALWRGGASLRGIAAELNTTPGSISVEMARMRADGWSLPRRNRGYDRERVAA